MKTTRLRFIPSSLAICPFPAVSPNLSLKIRSTNESRLFSRSRLTIVKRKIKLTVRCLPNCALKIIIMILYLSYPFFFLPFAFELLFFIILTLDFFRCARAHRPLRPCYLLTLWEHLVPGTDPGSPSQHRVNKGRKSAREKPLLASRAFDISGIRIPSNSPSLSSAYSFLINE